MCQRVNRDGGWASAWTNGETTKEKKGGGGATILVLIPAWTLVHCAGFYSTGSAMGLLFRWRVGEENWRDAQISS